MVTKRGRSHEAILCAAKFRISEDAKKADPWPLRAVKTLGWLRKLRAIFAVAAAI